MVSAWLLAEPTFFLKSQRLAEQRSLNLRKVLWASACSAEKPKRGTHLLSINFTIKLILDSTPHPPRVGVNIGKRINFQSLLPFLHPLRVVSVGIGVTSSIRPILIPLRAMALRADCAPGPGALSPVPPLARSLMWTAVILSCLRRLTISIAACMAAYGDDSSLSALTFMPPVTLARVYLPVRSVTWMNVSFQVARMWQTAKTSPEVFCGPRALSCLASTASSAAPSSGFAPFFLASLAGALVTAGAGFVYSFLTSAIIQNQYFPNNQYFIINTLHLSFSHSSTLTLTATYPSWLPLYQYLLMISTRKAGQTLLQSLKYNKVSWTTGNPYNVRWQYKWRPAYYTYLKDNFEPTHVGKPQDAPAVRPPFYSYIQDVLYRVFPSLKTIYFRSERYQDPFQIFVLPSLSIFFYQFWDLAFGFKGLTLLPWMFFWTRIRDRTLDPDINEVHLRDIIHQNPELGAIFKPETIHLLDYDIQYDTGFPCEKKFPEFKNKFFRFFNNDTHMCTGFFKFGDLESGATMTLHVKTMPVHGEFRYQVGEPYYFYDLKADVVHNGQFKEIVLVDQEATLAKKRPFLIII